MHINKMAVHISKLAQSCCSTKESKATSSFKVKLVLLPAPAPGEPTAAIGSRVKVAAAP